MENQELLNPDSRSQAGKGGETTRPSEETTEKNQTEEIENQSDNVITTGGDTEMDTELKTESEVENVTQEPESEGNEDPIELPIEIETETYSMVDSVNEDLPAAAIEESTEELVDASGKNESSEDSETKSAELTGNIPSALKLEEEVIISETILKESILPENEKLIASDHEDEEHEDHDDDTDDEQEDLGAKYSAMTREELVLAIEALVKNEDIGFIRRHISHIKVVFRNLMKDHSVEQYQKEVHATTDEEKTDAPVPIIEDDLSIRFDQAFGVYRDKKVQHDQTLEKQKQDNLVAKEALLEALRNLIESEEELKKTYDVFKELQDKWREIGQVPQNAKSTLWNNYHFLVEKFFDKVKINKELRDLDLKKNMELKTELCEKAEELLLDSSINKSVQKLQKLHDAWKEAGPVPKDKKDDLWERFKAASDAVNERRQVFFENLREEQNKNLSAKKVLCEQAEQFADFTADSPRKWQDGTDKINELFDLWKTVGFGPKKANEEVWVRFRTALDAFFRNKKDYFQKLKDEQNENYNQKLNLCMQAEALKESEDWRRTTDEMITLQKEWKKIGPVPRKFSDKIWKRFRTACDEFFNRKSDHFTNLGDKQDENLKLKNDLIEKVKSFEYSDDNNDNLTTLKDFQRQWMEIGHVPIKEKDKVQNEFRKVINEQFDKLNIGKRAKSATGFKSKIENLRNAPNADNIIYKERNALQGKISALQNDIKLWENNIGFFAASKKADVLKQEFEKKIEKAKEDILLMEEKLKILNQA